VVGTFLDVGLLAGNLPCGSKENQERTQLTEPVPALRSELETFRKRSKSDKYWGETSGGLN
jgi:hypothetical protein